MKVTEICETHPLKKSHCNEWNMSMSQIIKRDLEVIDLSLELIIPSGKTFNFVVWITNAKVSSPLHSPFSNFIDVLTIYVWIQIPPEQVPQGASTMLY